MAATPGHAPRFRYQVLGHGVDGCLGSRVLASCSHHAHRPIGKVDQWSFPRPSHELNYHVGFLKTARSQVEGSGHKVNGSLGSLHLAEPWKRGLGHSPASSQDYGVSVVPITGWGNPRFSSICIRTLLVQVIVPVTLSKDS